MEKWFKYAALTAVISSVWSLSVKYGLELFTPNEFAPWYSLVASTIIMVYVYKKYNKKLTKLLDFSIWGMLAGIFGGISMMMLTKSIYESPNPGLSVALFRGQ